MSLYCDAVFEGGGVKGIGFAGAISALEDKGYTFKHVAGASAGAIAAALIAVGYTGKEIEYELSNVDYKKFKQRPFLYRFGTIGKLINFSRTFGLYKADYFKDWLSELLERKGKTTFGCVKSDSPKSKYKYNLQVIASDLTDHRMLILPNDLVEFGIDPDTFPIVDAVRMSMGLPFFYRPHRFISYENKSGELQPYEDVAKNCPQKAAADGHRVHFVVDGGLLSNYPVWLLDDGTPNPPWPTFGFRFNRKNCIDCPPEKLPHNVIDYTKSIISTMLEAHDKSHISTSRGDKDRSILIPTNVRIKGKEKTVKTTDFNISRAESIALAENGRTAVSSFLDTWDFDVWKGLYR